MDSRRGGDGGGKWKWIGLYDDRVVDLITINCIDESLIYNKSITKKETWKPDFIISEFVKESNRKDSTDFNDVNIKDGKRDFYTNINNRENIEKIKSIIQSALTA